MLQLEQWQKPQEQQFRNIILRGDDAQRIAKARAILEENYQNPPTIQELVRLVYLNETKLIQGCKTCCNHTIHGYVVWIRMEKARQLLQQSQQSIGDIAYQVGYKTQPILQLLSKSTLDFCQAKSKHNCFPFSSHT